MDDDTIVALSTPPGRGGIAVIRISGDRTENITRKIVEHLPARIKPRKVYHRFIVDKKRHVDEGLIVFFKAPFSYTGEDLVEISFHSNPLLIEAILELILEKGARRALPGEFTYRAFKNGKIDLIQAESVNELINANTKYYAIMKFANLEGKLSRVMKKIKENLVLLGVKIETRIEFEEDQDFAEITLIDELEETGKNLRQVLENARFNELLNKGIDVVIVGKTNVGKSSLFNALLLEDRSIVSAIPGTTRDFIKEKLYFDGIPVEITDAAGINRGTRDDIEAQGMQRSLDKVAKSDAVIFMLDASAELDETDFEIYELVKKKNKIVTLNKMDIANPGIVEIVKSRFKSENILEISVKENSNVDKVRDFFRSLTGGIQGKELDVTVNQRQKAKIEKLLNILDTVNHLEKNGSVNAEVIAEEIRTALRIIGEILGEVSGDEILQQIFSRFCVGK